MTARPSVVVVGAGLSGLAAAWELSGGAPGDPDAPRIEVLEAAPRVGGPLVLGDLGGQAVDLGPDGFLARRPEARALIEELGLGDDLIDIGASGASLWLRGELRPIPRSLALGVPASRAALRELGGLSWHARVAAWRDWLVPRALHVGDDASIGQIVRTKLGDEIARSVVEPLVGGIQAGRIDDLSAAALLPGLLAAAQRGGSLMRALAAAAPPPAPAGTAGPAFHSLRGGLGALPQTLVDRLVARGVVVRTATPVQALRRVTGEHPLVVETATTATPADAVVVATPAAVTAALLGSWDPDLAALGSIRYAAAAMVSASYPEVTAPLPAGTGVLVPLGTPWAGGGTLIVTALTFLDRKWEPLRQPGRVLVRAHVGRSDDQRYAAFDDEHLGARVADEIALVLGWSARPTEVRVQRFLPGLPQYTVGYADLVARARDAAARGGVDLAGSTYDGVGIPASIGSGRRAARAALMRLAPRA